MMQQPGKHFYLAAGFFNDQQRDLCAFVEGYEAMGQPIYSPRRDGFVLKPDATTEERRSVFESNTLAIETASWVLAVVDDFDPGVIWEMGYAFAHGIPTLGYSDVEGRGLNVMLAGSCELGFINGRVALADLLNGGDDVWSKFPRNTWRGEIQ